MAANIHGAGIVHDPNHFGDEVAPVRVARGLDKHNFYLLDPQLALDSR